MKPKFEPGRALIEIENAWQLIAEQLTENDVESVKLSESVGRILKSDLISDIDSPPFAKSLMDGYAVADWKGAGGQYSVIETVTAGNLPQQDLVSGCATQIMTGCPVPAGTAGVVMIEQTERTDDQIKINVDSFVPGQNVLEQGHVIGKGQVLAKSGHLIQAHDVGTLAEFGFTDLQVTKKTSVAVLATGDELVDPSEIPGPGQIRNSNGSMLCQLAKAAGGVVKDLGIARDTKDDLNRKIQEGLSNNILVIAGGVSAGVLDLIPQCLAENGVEQVFHKINLKPGKPLWFGKANNGCLVFGLPGNPVSSLVCFKLFADPTIRNLETGSKDWVEFFVGRFAAEHSFKGGRRTFWPAQVELDEGGFELRPLDWKGSADQVTFMNANALISLDGEGALLPVGHESKFVWI